MTGLREIAQGAKTILIAGHLRPDGDCVGAAAAAYLYLKKIYPEAQISAYVEKVPEVYRFLDLEHSIFVEKLPEGPVDLFLSLDSSSKDRLGEAERLFDTAGRTACIDHHVSNLGYARENFVEAGSSSACEVLYGLMEEELIDTRIAEAIYIGIIMDTGPIN